MSEFREAVIVAWKMQKTLPCLQLPSRACATTGRHVMFPRLVDDQATAELMKRFYRGMLQEKLTPEAALRQAQVEMSQIPQWSSPYYWAAFVLQGDWGFASWRSLTLYSFYKNSDRLCSFYKNSDHFIIDRSLCVVFTRVAIAFLTPAKIIRKECLWEKQAIA
ncbi:CHAT domain-containing protein [Brasilonema octagenarum]|uniref:CHAT domain-containing protein n=1 Tax=Brasilonema octagenarum TaxID=417105 RepID=UPI001B7CFD4A|nr:CHAT domain-containing protein [Brasilonema octagenarum]